MTLPSVWTHRARIARLHGSVIHAPLRHTFIGELARVLDEAGRTICQAQTVGFDGELAVLSLVGPADRLSRACMVAPSGKAFELDVTQCTPGSVIDAHGRRCQWLEGVPVEARREPPSCGRMPRGAKAAEMTAVRYGADTPAHFIVARALSAVTALGRDAEAARSMLPVSFGKRLGVSAHDAVPSGVLPTPLHATVTVDREAPGLDQRLAVETRFETGIRAIDGILPCGAGQRVGVFAPAGAGKTTLMSMLIAHADADLFVIGLVGERGREVAELVQGGCPKDKAARTIVVFATSDRAPLERRNAAMMATAIAEHYRDQGLHVVLMIDSVTRYARALRDVALSAGEAPARRGYPASVFEQLPRLLERSGRTTRGFITAFYTVLLEDDEQGDPIGDEVRSILDGHIYLSRTLAAKGHFPAIDILRSASRVASAIADADTLHLADAVRDKLARLQELQIVLDLGEYRAGENHETDVLLESRQFLDAFLRQPVDDCSSLSTTLAMLRDVY